MTDEEKRRERALEASIAHWEEIYKNPTGKDQPFAEECALCAEYCDLKADENPCQGCPVMERSGYNMCKNTPYMRAFSAVEDFWEKISSDKTDILEELNFLKSLRRPITDAPGFDGRDGGRMNPTNSGAE